MDELYLALDEQVEKLKERLLQVNDQIYHRPELGNQEFFASQLLSTILKDAGFKVEIPYQNLETGFRAEFDTSRPGPKIAVMAEYDALPDIGHGCGHNMIAAIALGAALALAKLKDRLQGQIVVLGTPAEETNGAKVVYAQQGVFDDIDAAMMVHPSFENALGSSSLAIDPLQFEFFGRTCHASGNPEDGINALDAAIQTFNGINALRQHVTPDVRIHGVITEGGKTPNVTPDYAVARFYVRAKERKYLDTVVAKVIDCAKAGALSTGCSLEVSNFEYSNDNMMPNVLMTGIWEEHLRRLGLQDLKPLDLEHMDGSTDCGNVSLKIPTIHPSIGITGGEKVSVHTREFAHSTISKTGQEALLLAAKGVASTMADLLLGEDLLEKIKEEFESKISSK